MTSVSEMLKIWNELDLDESYPSYSTDNFGLGFSPYLMHVQGEPAKMMTLELLNYLNEYPVGRRGGGKKEACVSHVGKDGFQVCMDVAQFKPSELNVKVVNDSVIIEGKHEEREYQNGFIQRHFVRRYILPKGYDGDKVVSTLSSDGILTVSAPKPQIKGKSNERLLQIQQTGPAHMNVKQNLQEKIGDAGGAGNGVGGNEQKKTL